MALTVRHFFSVSALTFLSRLTGFLTIVLLGAALGLSAESDAFMVANVLPNIIFELVLGGLVSSVFVPLFARRRATLGAVDYRSESGALFLTLLLWLGVLSILASAAAPWLVNGMTIRADDGGTTRLLATAMFHIFALQIFFYGMSALAGALLNVEGRFYLAAAAPVLNNLVVLLTLAAYMLLPKDYFGLIGLTIGVTAGVATMGLAQLVGLARMGWPLDAARRSFWHPQLGSALRLGLPLLGLIAFQQAALAVRSNLASAVPGGFTALQHVFRFFQLPYGILAVTITTLVVPRLAERAASGDRDEFWREARRGFVWTTAILLPIAILYALLAPWLMHVLMARGRMSTDDTALLGELLFYYALAVFPYSLLQYVVRIFYAIGDTTTAVWLLGGVNAASIAACLALFPQAQLQGIAFGMLLAYALGAALAVLLAWRLKRLASLDTAGRVA